MNLNEAVYQRGLLLKLRPTSDKFQIELMIANAGNSQHRVNLLGTVLKPSHATHQRLMVIGTRNAEEEISIPAGCRRTISLKTVCMDEFKKTPETHVRYEVSSETPNEELVDAAKAWLRSQRRALDVQGILLPEEEMTQQRVQDIAWRKIAYA